MLARLTQVAQCLVSWHCLAHLMLEPCSAAIARQLATRTPNMCAALYTVIPYCSIIVHRAYEIARLYILYADTPCVVNQHGS
jgi:hypothetical protein